MKWMVLLLFLPVVSSAQEARSVYSEETFAHTVAQFLQTDRSDTNAASLYSFVHKLESKRTGARSDESFLRTLFFKTHERFLKTFQEHASFSALVDHGDYNCLSATALYALLLDHFNMNYEVVETNYHIFITVLLDGKKILIETTDPVNGFVTDEKEFDQRIAKYKKNVLREDDKNYYRLSCSLYKKVSLTELTGLLHYNLAVRAYNEKNLDEAIEHLDQATAVYCSPRMEELTRVVLLSVIESRLNNTAKEICVRKIQVFRKRNLMALASASASAH